MTGGPVIVPVKLKTFNASGPPQSSVEFPAQTMLHDEAGMRAPPFDIAVSQTVETCHAGR